jgi:SulP family sulfate permease
VKATINADGWKIYELEGTLFFASIANFQDLFTPYQDPQDVVIEFKQSKVADHSALAAIDALASRYQSAGKKLHLRHLSPDCLDVLENAKGMIEVNLLEDPKYHVADNKLG